MLLTAGQFENVHVVGLVIGRSGPMQEHVGFLYLTENGPRMCHFAWHYHLRDDDPNQLPWADYLWADLMIEEEENRTALAAFIGAVATHGAHIAYGFSFTGQGFQPDGSLVDPPPGQGMTCATFVHHVLDGAGMRLLDLESWESRVGDDEWREAITQKLVPYASQEHIDKVRANEPGVRIRPQDVVGAGLLSPWPVAFADAEEIAASVLAELHDKVAVPA